MIWGNESNNDYIAPIIKIEEPRASELTIWEASGLAKNSFSLCELPFRTSLIILHALRCAVKVDVNLFSGPNYGEMRTGFSLVEPENVSLPLKTLYVLQVLLTYCISLRSHTFMF